MILSFQSDKEELTLYLRERGFIPPDQSVLSLEKPGEGNMNFVARVRTQSNSIIVKQANPYVQKYPHIQAPRERIFVEAEFYKVIKKYNNLSASMPFFIGLDEKNYILVLEDLGTSSDFTFLYQKGKELSKMELSELVQFLNELHTIPLNELKSYPSNLGLRKLNHEHLFIYPFAEDNGFDLNKIQQGLQELAMTYKTQKEFKSKTGKLGDIYLSEGSTLLHGDFYPGSWLKTRTRLKIIDPEFSYAGRKEFDLGIFMAHLKMSEAANQHLDWVASHYETGQQFDWNLCYQFLGIEIMRRIIGLAQLPFDLTLEEKEKLLKQAHQYIMKGA